VSGSGLKRGTRGLQRRNILAPISRLRCEMSTVARAKNRSSSHAHEPGDGGKRLVMSCVGSIAFHVLLLALMIMGVDIYAGPIKVTETPFEVIFEAKADSPAAQSVEHLPVSQQSPAASLNAQPQHAFDPREIADEEHQQKAWPDGTMINGDGTDKSRTASLSDSGKRRDSEELKNDPDKEVFRLVPPRPKDPESPQGTKIAPPGQGSKPTAKEEPKEEADASTAKRQQITCGANAKALARSSQVQRRGQVLGQLTKDQANRMIQITQANRDMYISPEYVDNIRVFVHVERTRDGAWTVALLPHGLAAQSGDRVEFTLTHLDPFRPCHYIPNLVSSVL
jgi:hypothetical protein